VKEISFYTDGSCLGNPGPIGYAAIMQCDNKERIAKGHMAIHDGTNNQAELLAVIEGLKWLNRVQKEPCIVHIYTDSNTNLLCSRHSDMSLMAPERANNKLWVEYITQRDNGKHQIVWIKVAGHKDCEQNNRADKIAKAEALKARHELYGGKK